MKKLLEAGVNPNVNDFEDKNTILCYAYQNKKHRAFRMLLENVEYVKIDPTMKN